MRDNDQPLAIALPRSDWLLVEQALIAAVTSPRTDPHSARASRWMDLLGMIGREREPISAREAQRRRMAQR